MKIQTNNASARLGISATEMLDLAAPLVDNLSDVWPAIDEGYVDTLRQLYGLPMDVAGESPSDQIIQRPKPRPLTAEEEASARILDKLERQNHWGGNTVSWDTIRNHYCKGIHGLESALTDLVDEELIIVADKGKKGKGPFSLNTARKGDIQKIVARIRK